MQNEDDCSGPCASPAMTCKILRGVPDHLRGNAATMLHCILEMHEQWELGCEEIALAIVSPSFRPILEQEAQLDSLSLAK